MWSRHARPDQVLARIYAATKVKAFDRAPSSLADVDHGGKSLPDPADLRCIPANATMTTPAQPLRFSRIGLGCVTFGREIDHAASFVMMDHAVARGITHFDTAAAYGAGESERAVGAWLEARKHAPGTITVATKILPPYEPSSIQETVKQSRERLGGHGIDLLYLHRWDPSATNPAALQTLDAL